MAVGRDQQGQGAVFITDDAGTSWRAGTIPSARIEFLSNVDCPSATLCAAAGTSGAFPLGNDSGKTLPVVLTSHDGGRSWDEANLKFISQASGQGTYPIACPTDQDCVVVNFNRRYDHTGNTSIYTSDGGTSWHESTVSGEAENWSTMTGISCLSAGTCVAVGSVGSQGDPDAVVTSPAFAGPWKLALWAYGSGPPWLGSATGAVCLSSAACVVVGQTPGLTAAGLLVSKFTSYRQAQMPTGAGPLAGWPARARLCAWPWGPPPATNWKY